MTSLVGTSHHHEHDEGLHVVVVTTGATASILLQGEADLGSLTDLCAALHDGELGHATAVELNATDLFFCDVASMRELALFARQAKAQGRVVTTTGASPLMRRMARMMGVVEDLRIL